MTTTIQVIFVIPEEYEDETECSEIMHSAFQACKANTMQVQWTRDCTHLLHSELKKTDFVVFEKFEGEQFLKLKNTKATRIVGPKCLFTCLIEGRPVPNLSWPLYDLAMLDCFITASHISKKDKEGFRDKIHMMAGQYADGLFEMNTHLITDSVRSEKYLKAAELGVKLMLPTWVDAVFDAAKTENVYCDDERFDNYRCPPLHKLIISSTGFTSLDERAEMKRLVKENGGTYAGQLHVSTTDVLICKGATNSEKYNAARKSNRIKCVSYEWLVDSIAKGYALKEADYAIKKSTSTPTKTGEMMDPNFSVMSAISCVGSTTQRSIFQETVNVTTNTSDIADVTAPPRKRKSSSLDEVNDIIDSIDIKAVKRAGSFLDGCCVYIAGFTADQREKMSRVLNLGGATRYDQISDRITHIIVGDPTQGDVRALQKEHAAPIVSLQWLCDCIKRQRVVNEEEYLVSLQMKNITVKGCDSPISQKGLKLLRREISSEAGSIEQESENQVTLCGEVDGINDTDRDILQQYLKPNATGEEDTLARLLQGNPFNSNQLQNPSNEDTTNVRIPQLENNSVTSKKAIVNADSSSQSTNISITATEDELTEQFTFFHNFKFLVFYFDAEQTAQLQECIEKCGGQVQTITNETPVKEQIRALNLTNIDYIIVPVFTDNTKEILEDTDKIVEIINKKTKYQNKTNSRKIDRVTDYFIMDCYQHVELVPIEYYHKPIVVNNEKDDDGTLSGCVVTISSYSGTERVFLNNLIVKLGGISQEQLCRIQKAGILASTHLLNPEPSGKKYEAAIRWGIPVVSKDWLLECSKTGNFELEENYLVGDAKAPLRTAVPKHRTPEPTKANISLAKVTPPTTDNISPPLICIENHTDSKTLSQQTNFSSSSLKENTDTNIQIRAPSADKSSNALNVCRDINSSGILTPTKSKYFPTSGKPVYTPLNRIIKSNQESPQFCSQVTPLNELMNRFKMNNMISTPTSTPPLPKRYKEVDTPDTPETPYGAFIRPNPSPNLRKECLKWINGLPEHKPRRNSTPFSELKRKLWDKITHQDGDANKISQPDFSDDNDVSVRSNNTPVSPETPHNAIISSKLQQLQQMLSSSGSSRSSLKRRESMVPSEMNKEAVTQLKNSQACTVGWDYVECNNAAEQQQPAIENREMMFMITSIETTEKETLIRHIQELGAKASDLQQFDINATHLLAPKPQRTEKMLSCMAAGKLILHPSYIEECTTAGRLLEEDAFEYGNPIAKKDIMAAFEKDKKMSPQALHHWRVEISKRGYGAFHDMRAIIISPKRDPIVRIVEAGGGMVIDVKPPFDDDVYATHCLVDPKIASDVSVFVPLAKQGIYCVNTTFVNDFLYRNIQDVRDAILPDLAKYYKE